MEEKTYYTYMVKCCDDTLYTGYTTDLEHRVKVHNEKKGAKSLISAPFFCIPLVMSSFIVPPQS